MLENHESPYNIFKLVNSMRNLRKLILRNTKIVDLPEKVLTNPDLILLESKNLQIINNYSYYELKDIKNIIISGSFDSIPSNAFVVKNFDNNKVLTINFQSSNIIGSSFESGVFLYPNRTLSLEFQTNPKLTYLDENVFGPLFDNHPNSTIKFNENPLDCNDCNLKWIINRSDELFPKLIDAKCSDGKSLYNLTIDDLINCSQVNGMGQKLYLTIEKFMI